MSTTTYDFVLKTQNESPSIARQLQDENGNPVDIEGYESVDFLMGPIDGDTLTIDATMVVEDAQQGLVRYDWQDGDTTTAGTYLGEIVVTYAGNLDESYPNGRHLYIRIDKSLAERR